MHLLAACILPTHLIDLEDQLFKAIHMALHNASKDMTYIIANLWAWRREAHRGRLRPSFS
ncbi:hypothetical protein E2C01_044754 [Portunus trituberculatus]|uniref:Uncharacterized protein n=1 Tax=Portunus trituberculatus TaxID=210409 RepID=A0A5B7FTX6_PORTR|nr:hypothetical protein [Portunus trituberculatus]